jgi:hypothetical protein
MKASVLLVLLFAPKERANREHVTFPSSSKDPVSDVSDARATARYAEAEPSDDRRNGDQVSSQNIIIANNQQLTYKHCRFFHSSCLPVRLVSLLLKFVLYLSFPFSCGACLPLQLQLLQRLRLPLLLILVSVRFDQPLHSPRDADLNRHLST